MNGITVTDAVLRLSDSLNPFLSKPLSLEIYPYRIEYFEENDIQELGAKELGELAQHDAIFLGAVGDPRRKHVKVETGILLSIRQTFDQYINLRPVELPAGVPSVLANKGSQDIDFVICRENTEGLYAGRGRIVSPGTDYKYAVQEMVCSDMGVRRLVEYATNLAIERPGESRLHIVFKNNVLKYAAQIWEPIIDEYQQRTDVDVQYMHVDAFVAAMITRPEQFHVVCTENMFGYICTDLGAVLQGGMNVAVSGNLNPTREHPSMFEPVHGTAPDLGYDDNGQRDESLVQRIKPEAAMLSFAMMLEHLGESRGADALKHAALSNLRHPDYQEMKLDELTERAGKIILTYAESGETFPASQ